MLVNHRTILAALALALAGCSGSHGGSTAQQGAASPAAANAASPAPSVETAAADAGSSASSLPVYPGATKVPNQMKESMKMCGSNFSMTLYEIKGTDADAVAKWYDSRVPNGVHLNVQPETASSATTQTNDVILKPDGSGGVMVLQMHFTSSLANAAKTIGADRTSIGITSYDPPLAPDLMQDLQQGTNGDPAAKAAARAQIKAKCGNMFANQ
ncbi:MAG TPA: hypothetical protein VGF86_14960 [Candidatus Tumulicola sp.]|jgi:hypothetical protein